jgi:transposase-like protein
MPETRRKYDPEFKEGAVRIVRETGKPIAQIARDLGVHEGTLGNWVAKDRAEREGTEGLSMGDAAELKRLRAENAQLRMERDVLKRSVVLWVLSRDRDNTHNAEHRIMPRTPLNRLRGKGSVSTHSA